MEINCCVLALTAFLGNIIQLVFFFNYSLKLKDKSIELEKKEKSSQLRIKELEKKNGHELSQLGEQQEQINELKKEIEQLKQN